MYLYLFVLIVTIVSKFNLSKCRRTITVSVTQSVFAPEDCKLLGFTSNLYCSTCEIFNTSKLEPIFENCNQCCLKEDESGTKKYPKAVLEVCTCKFGAYPQIQAFIKSDRPKKYKNLSIKYVRGLDPIIKLYDNEDKYVEGLDIHKWNTDSVDEFLDTHLIKD